MNTQPGMGLTQAMNAVSDAEYSAKRAANELQEQLYRAKHFAAAELLKPLAIEVLSR